LRRQSNRPPAGPPSSGPLAGRTQARRPHIGDSRSDVQNSFGDGVETEDRGPSSQGERRPERRRRPATRTN
jgi:hypothetical protein